MPQGGAWGGCRFSYFCQSKGLPGAPSGGGEAEAEAEGEAAVSRAGSWAQVLAALPPRLFPVKQKHWLPIPLSPPGPIAEWGGCRQSPTLHV